MIMEGLETLVTPSHHAYLLTESAAAAHFNVLSFDTCSLFKTAATTASSFNLNNNHTISNNHHQTQLLSNHHQQQMQQPTTQSSSNTTSNSSSISNTSSHSATSVTHSKTDTVSSSSTTATTTTSTSSGHHHHHVHHPTLNIQETQQQSADRGGIQLSQTGDLNTPVTTSSDHPSFFGPSSVVEPPIITGELKILRYFKQKNWNF
jgi:hypothetical protein